MTRPPARFGLLAALVLYASLASVGIGEPLPGGTQRETSGNPAVQVTRTGDDRSRVTLTAPDIILKDTVDAFYQARIPLLDGESQTWVDGAPSLPQITRFLKVANTGGIELHVTDADYDVIDNVDVLPTVTEDETPGGAAWRDPGIYKTDGWYPPEPVVLSEPQIMRDFRVVNLTLYPVQVNPVRRQIRIYRALDADVVSTAETGQNEIFRTRPISRDWVPIYERMISNLDEADLLEVQRTPGSYLIIYPSSQAVFLVQATRLATWKRSLGFKVELYGLPNPWPTNPVQALRAVIADRFANTSPPLEYVCFMGGPDFIPTSVFGEEQYSSEYDHYYAKLVGGDCLADIAVGRIPAANSTEVVNAVDKIIAYEKTPYTGNTSWYSNALLVGGAISQCTSPRTTMIWGREQFEHLHPSGSAFFHQYNSQPISGFVPSWQNHWTTGPGAAFYLWRGTAANDHGGNPSFAQLNTYGQFPIAMWITCGTGHMVRYGDLTPHHQFSRWWVTNSGTLGGAAAIGMDGFSTHAHTNNILMGGFIDAVCNRDVRTVGNAMVFAKNELFRVDFDEVYAEYTANWCNLMGDPSMSMWTQPPAHLAFANLPTTAQVGTHGLPIRVVDETAQGVTDVLVVALAQDGTFTRAFTGADGVVFLPLLLDAPGTWTLTASKRNCVPAVRDVAVQALGQTCVSLHQFSLPGGPLRPGVQRSLRVDLKNYNSQVSGGSAQLITATLASSNPQLQILTGNALLYPDLDPLEIAGPLNNATFTLLGGTTMQDQDSVELCLEVFLAGQSHSVSNFSLVCQGGQVVQEQDAQIPLVSQDNNGNGHLDPAETAYLRPSLKNCGALALGGPVAATLSCLNGYVQVLQHTATYGTIAPNARITCADEQFSVHVSAGVYPGDIAKMRLVVHPGDVDHTLTVDFDLPLGHPVSADPTGPDGYGYYAYESFGPQAGLPNDQTYGTLTPFSVADPYSWVEIRPAFGGNGQVLPNMGDPGEQHSQDPFPYTSVQTLPFPFQFYGTVYTQITICSNGWAAFGNQSDYIVFHNYPIPGQQCPDAMIAPLWTDLRTWESSNTMGLGVWHYNDVATGRYIIQWEARLASSYPNSYVNPTIQRFQLILKNPSMYPTRSRDGIVVVQYNDVNHAGATAGIASVRGLQGLEYHYAVTPAGAHPFPGNAQIRQRAVTYTTGTEIARFGEISGHVTSAPHGYLLSGFVVRVTGTGTGTIDSATVDPSGYYEISNLPIDVYRLECLPVSQPWYDAAQHDPVYVGCEQTIPVEWIIHEPADEWTADMSPVIVNDTLHIIQGMALVIHAGVEVRFGANAALVVDPGATLTIDGAAAAPVLLHEDVANTGWTGLFVNGGRLEMRYAEVHDVATATVYTQDPTAVHISHSVFEGNRTQSGGHVLRLWGSPGVTQTVDSSRVYHVTQGTGLNLFNAKVSFSMDTIRDCSQANSYIHQVTGRFDQCTFTGRASQYSILISGATCVPNFYCCTFDNISPASGSFATAIFCGSGTQPGFGYSYGESIPYNGSPGHANVIRDSSPYLLTLQGNGSLPNVGARPSLTAGPGGYNEWYQNSPTGRFFEWREAGTGRFNCRGQYWNPGGTAPSMTLFTPANAARWDVSLAVATPQGLCSDSLRRGSHGGSLLAGDPQRTPGITLDDESWPKQFDLALQMEESGLYREALREFAAIAASVPDAPLRWSAATRVVTTAAQLPPDNGWVAGLLDSLIAAADSYDLRVFGQRLLTCQHMNRRDWGTALTVCADLLNSGLTNTDSIQVAIDLIGVQLAAGTTGSSGAAEAAGHGAIPPSLRVTSAEQGMAREQELIALLGAAGVHHAPQAEVVPISYRLYQNYPNPFNPATEIRFDLPETSQVEVRVFNLLGQDVVTLVNGLRPAGAYRIQWDGKDASGSPVSTGMYLCRLTTGGFTDTKKMLLLK